MSHVALHRRLTALANPERATVNASFFKTGPGEYGEGDRFIGVNVPTLRKLSREFDDLPLRRVATLLSSRWHEERLLALLILVRQYQHGEHKQRDAIHNVYLKNTRYINNWDLVDSSAEHIVGPHLRAADRTLLVRLAKSKDLWERRIAMLATFHYIKAGEYKDALRIATLLLDDPHDLIHKAVGWMLREIGNRDRRAEEAFLRKHASRMPRTMLRYAVERFPEALRRRYLNA